jgi:hypothetical protein
MGGPDGRYLGIQRWRFYIKCTHCARTISFLTDPKNADYEMESGGTRNYEVYKDKARTEEESAVEKEQEEKEDMMKALENRVLDSQREMADLDNLEEIKAMNKRHVQLLSAAEGGFDADAKAVMAARLAKQEQLIKKDAAQNENGITEEDEAMIKSITFGHRTSGSDVVRLTEEDEEKEEKRRREEVERIKARQQELDNSAAIPRKTSMPVVKIKRKKVESTPGKEVSLKKSRVVAASVAETVPEGLSGLLGGYGSDSDST